MKTLCDVSFFEQELSSEMATMVQSDVLKALYDYFVCTHAVQHATERVTLDDLDKAYKRCCELLGAEMPPEIDPFPVIDTPFKEANASLPKCEHCAGRGCRHCDDTGIQSMPSCEPPFAKRQLGDLS